jgi:hypothetical protein
MYGERTLKLKGLRAYIYIKNFPCFAVGNSLLKFVQFVVDTPRIVLNSNLQS